MARKFEFDILVQVSVLRPSEVKK